MVRIMLERTDPNGPERLDWIVPCFPPTASPRTLAPIVAHATTHSSVPFGKPGGTARRRPSP